jgi:hypothetical protein
MRTKSVDRDNMSMDECYEVIIADSTARQFGTLDSRQHRT